MKLPKLASVLLLTLVFIFTGCTANNPNSNGDSQNAAPITSDSQEDINPTPDAAQTPNGTVTESDKADFITAHKAEAIALAHANVSADDAQRLRSEFDYDNGVAEYDIDFYYDGYEYDYDINAITGEVIWHEKEPQKSEESNTDRTDTNATSADAVKLTAADAEAVALKHARYTADEVNGLRSELDRDNGVYEYDIEFRVDGYEFDYEINAETGKIISHDKEQDD